MILHDRVEVIKPGGTDPYGYPLPATSQGIFPAQVSPLSTEELVKFANIAITRVRAVMPVLSLVILSTWQVKHAGKTFKLIGTPQTHRINGRAHHIELLLEAVGG